VTYASRSAGAAVNIPGFSGISTIFPISAPFGRENGKPNQAFAGKFPLPP
jgi:hypothetical protein